MTVSLFSCGQQLYNSLRRSVRPSVGPSVGRSVGPSVKKCQKVDSGPKNPPMMMVNGLLEAYGQVVSLFEDFFSPFLAPLRGVKNTPKTPLFVKKKSKSL